MSSNQEEKGNWDDQSDSSVVGEKFEEMKWP